MNKFEWIAFLAVALASLSSFASDDKCINEAKGCSEIDIDSPHAESAFQVGCNAKDYYSCARLGQFYQNKKKDISKALVQYDKACAGKDEFGCEQSYEIHMDLCYLQKKSQYCGKREPKGDYRVLAYLTKFEEKYADAFSTHNFESQWSVKAAEELFQKRLKAKDKNLLRVLEAEYKKGKHDGADAEAFSFFVSCLKKKGTCEPQDYGG